jgi:hypothetical protein
VFRFEDIREAHRAMESNQANGTMVAVVYGRRPYPRESRVLELELRLGQGSMSEIVNDGDRMKWWPAPEERRAPPRAGAALGVRVWLRCV